MPKTFRTIQQWNHWLSQPPGAKLLNAEQLELRSILNLRHGKFGLLLGVPNQYSLLSQARLGYLALLSSLMTKEKNIKLIESEFHELAISSGSVDLVLLPHTLEYIENPRQLLIEACRIVKPNGYLIILGFNPYSFLGLKKLFMKNTPIPWSGNFLHKNMVKKWLALADFELVEQKMLFFSSWSHPKFKLLQEITQKLFAPLGGVYILIAQAKTIPLTPIKLSWKQEITRARISPTGI